MVRSYSIWNHLSIQQGTWYQNGSLKHDALFTVTKHMFPLLANNCNFSFMLKTSEILPERDLSRVTLVLFGHKTSVFCSSPKVQHKEVASYRAKWLWSPLETSVIWQRFFDTGPRFFRFPPKVYYMVVTSYRAHGVLGQQAHINSILNFSILWRSNIYVEKRWIKKGCVLGQSSCM